MIQAAIMSILSYIAYLGLVFLVSPTPVPRDVVVPERPRKDGPLSTGELLAVIVVLVLCLGLTLILGQAVVNAYADLHFRGLSTTQEFIDRHSGPRDPIILLATFLFAVPLACALYYRIGCFDLQNRLDSMGREGEELKFTPRSASVGMAIFSGLFAVMFQFYALTTYLRVEPTEIVVSRCWSGAVRYPYNRIRRVVNAQVRIDRGTDRIWVVFLDNGHYWESLNFKMRAIHDAAMIKLIAQRAGLSVDDIPNMDYRDLKPMAETLRDQ